MAFYAVTPTEHNRRTTDPDPPPALLRQMIVDNDDKQEEAHHRLRVDWREHDRRLEQIERDQSDTRAMLRNVERMIHDPRDVSTLRLTPGQMFVIVAACLSIAGGWAARGVLALQVSGQMQATKIALDTLQQKATMQDLKLQNLERTILTNRSQ